ncbi:MAG TPA: GNAT family N-acetyltransferase [Pyrinomonadaceae bacterium]|jgi:GNAT superfamily N-acetyltransferase|nr:GNAT family N-acetyltransferase [Pyrinomonadaceae bacterium]
MSISVRNVTSADITAVLGLIREFAAFEDLTDYCEVDEDRLETALFTVGATAEGLIAEDDGQAIGYALFFPNFSSFRGQRGFYLDDIYVTESYRGRGVGELMLKELARLAEARGYERIDFLVLDWNTPAIGFYKKLGANVDEAERHFKFTDDAFKTLAS